MDEMKIRINSEFMRKWLAKRVKDIVKKKAGYEVGIRLNELNASYSDGIAHVHLNVDVNLNKDELAKLLKSIDL